MVLNVTDEVIQGNPKYNVIENGDGTKTIELVNEVVHEGTNLNKALFDKVENVLSYNVPSVQTEVIPISDSSDVNGLIDSNTNNYVEETNLIKGNCLDLNNIEIKLSSSQYTNEDLKKIITNDSTKPVLSTSTSGSLNLEFPFEVTIKHLVFNYYYTGNNGVTYLWYGNDFDNMTNINIGTQLSGAVDTHFNSNVFNATGKCFKISFKNGTSRVYKFNIDSWSYQGQARKNKFQLLNSVVNTNNQIVLINTPNDTSTDNIVENNLDNIQIDTILQPNKYYELIYDETNNRFIADEVRV